MLFVFHLVFYIRKMLAVIFTDLSTYLRETRAISKFKLGDFFFPVILLGRN
jgi:hypothetical protein